MSREFYQRVRKHYANPAAWKFERPEDYRSTKYAYEGDDVMWFFEPHIAENILALTVLPTPVLAFAVLLQKAEIRIGQTVELAEIGAQIKGRPALGDEQAPLAYGEDPKRDMAGVFERIAPFRWRLVIPWPQSTSKLDVFELTPVALQPGA